MGLIEFKKFPKIPRFKREMVITEKIDGTNAQVFVTEDGDVFAGSRNRWLTVDNDNFGFAKWCLDNKEELVKLGPGNHYGEWWGLGIQRGYGLREKRFSLFNVSKWGDPEVRPKCCHVVPVLLRWPAPDSDEITRTFNALWLHGSFAAPGFMLPEGIVVYHSAGNHLYKMTYEGDDHGKEAAQ
jgi:RNA ligase